MDAPIGDRISRFWAVFTDQTAYLPLVIVDSGHRLMTGDQGNFQTAFQRLVDPELTRPPQAEVEAYARQVGTRMRVYARVRNTSAATLSASLNQAALHALVYEDAHVGVTGRIVRAAPWLDLASPLPPGEVRTATLETLVLTAVNWSALHTVVLVDCVPGPGPAFDMLQAAIARPAELSVDPATLAVGVDSGVAQDRSLPVRLAGPYVLNWTATPDSPWLTVRPDAGAIADEPSVTVLAGGLAPGLQEGHVTLSATSEDGMVFTQFLTVTAFLGPRVVRASGQTATPGSPISVPVGMSALGDEHEVHFSLAFDPAMLGAPTAELGSGAAAATLTVDDTQTSAGRLGIAVVLPDGQAFPQGDHELVVVTFQTPKNPPGPAATVGLSDLPVARSIRDVWGTHLTAGFEDATVLFPGESVARTPRRHLWRAGN